MGRVDDDLRPGAIHARMEIDAQILGIPLGEMKGCEMLYAPRWDVV